MVAEALSLQRRVVKNSGILAATFVFSILVGLATTVLLARLLGRDDLGRYGYYYRLFAWLSTAALLFVPRALIRYVAELHGKGQMRRAWRLLKGAAVLQTGIIFLVLCGFAVYFVWRWRGDDADLVPIAAILCAFGAFSFGRVGESFLHGCQAFGSAALAGVAGALLRVAGLSLLLVVGGGVVTALGVMAAGQVVYVVIIAFALVLLWRRNPGADSANSKNTGGLGRRIIEYGGTMALAGLLSMVTWDYIEVFFIDYFWSGKPGHHAQLAYYTVATALAMMPMRLGRTMSRALLPAFSELYGQGDWARLSRGYHVATVASATVGSFACVLAAAVAVPVFRLMFPHELLPAVIPFRLLLIPAFLMAVNYAGAAAVPAIEGHRFLLVWTVLSAPMNLALDVLLVPRWGAVGAALVNAIMQGAGAVGGIWYLAVHRKMGFPVGKIGRLSTCALIAGMAAYVTCSLGSAAKVPHFAGLALALVLSSICYLCLLRFFAVLGESERSVFESCGQFFPGAARPWFGSVVEWVVSPRAEHGFTL